MDSSQSRAERASSADQGSLIIRGAHVLTMGDDDRSGVLDIRIDDGRITAVAESLSTQGVDRVIEAEGCVAMPGLVQAHVHLCQTLFRGHADELELLDWLRTRIWPMEGALSRDDLRASARLGIAELLLGGTTTILDMGTVRHTDVLFEEAERTGIRYTGGKTIMDQGQGYPATLREQTANAVAESRALCDAWQGRAGGRLRYAFSPRFVLSCTEEAMVTCVEQARATGALLHTHASENSEEVEIVRQRTGMGNVEYLHSIGFSGADVLLAHGVWLSAHERCLLRDTGTHVVHCPSTNLKLASGIARIDELIEQGIHVALGADGAPCNNNLDGFMEMRLLALLHKVRGGPLAIGPRRALRMATRGGAEALGLRDVGCINVGWRADIILVDLRTPHAWPPDGDLASRLVYSAHSSDVRTVIVDGRVLVQDRKLLADDEDDVLAVAREASRRVLREIS